MEHHESLELQHYFAHLARKDEIAQQLSVHILKLLKWLEISAIEVVVENEKALSTSRVRQAFQSSLSLVLNATNPHFS